MKEREIFEHLLAIPAVDPRGSVSACLVIKRKIMVASGSGEDGYTHAENIVLDEATKRGIEIPPTAYLYVTLEPCSRRTDPTMKDCVTHIIESGVKHVIFGARDPSQSEEAGKRLATAGVTLAQYGDTDIVRRCAELFNGSVGQEHIGIDVDLKPTD